jgi:DNA-binding transcriptional regulator YhcF (GntR family)
VAKAYQRLTDAGVLTVRRGEGTFVADRPPTVPAAQRRRELQEAAEKYAQIVNELGVDRDEAVDVLRGVLERNEPNDRSEKNDRNERVRKEQKR